MITVIIPIYNADKKIESMLKCLQNQSFTDFEVIMIDDGSTDDTSHICKKYAAEDTRYKYFYQQNKGVSAARNYGMQKAKGEYIAFVDADDRIDNNYFEALVKGCQNADIAVCDTVIESNGAETGRFTGNFASLDSYEALNMLLSRKIINSGPCAKLYRRDIIGNIEFPTMKTYEDILFNIMVFEKAKSVCVTSETQYHYIENKQGAMSKMKAAPSTDIIVASEKIMDFIINNESNLSAECTYVTISHLFQYVASMVLEQCQWDYEFIAKAQKFYKTYLTVIFRCTAVPAKEKIVFALFAAGIAYIDKKWFYINHKR